MRCATGVTFSKRGTSGAEPNGATAPRGTVRSVFRHVVLFRFHPDADDAAKAAIAAGLGELPAAIPTIRAYRFGADAGVNEGNWDYAVTADFDDEAGYLVYRDHPAHRQVIVDHIAPAISDRASVQFAGRD